MGIVIHGAAEQAALRCAGRVAALTLDAVCERIRAGVSTADIDAWVREDTAARGGTPSQLGYKGFPAAVCTSRNEVVCHGVPSPTDVLREGDIVNVDVTTCFEGFHGDTSRTVMIGDPTPDARRVTECAQKCLAAGIEAARPGGRLGDIGAAIEAVAARYGCGVVEEFGGHGIGTRMHMPPHVSHRGTAGRGVRLRPGMAFTIEPMITIGNPKLRILDDGWTVITMDRTPSAQFEHTVLVTTDGIDVLTVSPSSASTTDGQSAIA